MSGLRKIISGAQTGVDMAALDSAISRLVFCWGGWVPKGRTNEDGRIPESYFDVDRFDCGLQEHPGSSRNYRARTIKNIQSSDATMILRISGAGRVLGPGTKLTIATLQKMDKPYRLFDPSKIYTVPKAAQWICQTKDVAGSRESKDPGIYKATRIFLDSVFSYVFMYQRWGIRIWAPQKMSSRVSR